MAVYTEVSDEELQAFAAEYAIGTAIACKGIAEGIENSNYLLTTTQGNFILTIYERRVRREDLPYFLGLMSRLDHIQELGVDCIWLLPMYPSPFRDERRAYTTSYPSRQDSTRRGIPSGGSCRSASMITTASASA